MRRAARLTTLLHAMTAIVIALSLAACKERVPHDPRSPPKPRMHLSTAPLPIACAHAVSRLASHQSKTTTEADSMERCDAA